MEKQSQYTSYEDYVESLFHCVDLSLQAYLNRMKIRFATGNGYKNVMYPELETAADACDLQVLEYQQGDEGKAAPQEMEQEETPDWFDEDLAELFGAFADESQKVESTAEHGDSTASTLEETLNQGDDTVEQGVDFPLHHLIRKQKLDTFTAFCLISAVMSSQQSVYGRIFQVVNQNGNCVALTIESAAQVYYGEAYSVHSAYNAMSRAVEQLKPLFNLQIQPDMPFATQVSADKRLIDFLFGDDPGALDSNYTRFYRMLTNTKPLDPIMTNQKQLDSLNISYDSGVRLFNLFGDEGSGRKFFIQNFCKEREMNGIILDCHKLFAYDISFLERALWAVCRECILSNCSCTLDGMEFREDEKEHFYSNFDLTLGKLSGAGITVFCVSEMKLPLREMTKQAFTQLELDTPGNYERFEIWKYYAQGYCFEEDVDLEEMATKFLFTAGKVKGAITQSRALADMERLINISRYCIFEACYGQMKHELTQKATKVKVVYTLDDIVMNPTQRETIERVCEQMRYRKQVYEKWDYNRKYPYGRGLSVLLFGAPGTGKSMSAQVIASALNLELYRVDLSKVVDKYVGETEKSISMIFREAKKCNVVLFFDEADTMFGKRTDSGGSGESAANNKTAHLLQEVEAYDGVTVLATNYKHNIDPAFFRRMKFIVEYQFPDPDTREMLWRTTIPKGTPLADDVDIRFLAERFEFAGGNIKNCILNAAFFGAAEGDGSKVYMKNYLEAIRYEFIKTGKIFAKTDFEPYASLLGLD